MQPTSDVLEDYHTTPGADARDLTPQQADSIRESLNSNLFVFCQEIFQYKDLHYPLHGELCAYIRRWGQPGRERIMTQIPREFFKTSVGTRANALWQICREPNKPVAIFNERDVNAKKWLRAIRDVVQGNLLFQQVYRHLLPVGIAYDDSRSMPRWWKWSDESMDFQGKDLGDPEASISAHGVEAATTGGHWPKLILDDLISVKHKLSQVEMERVREWIRNHVYLMRPAEHGLSYVNCTPWTYTDIYVDLVKSFNYKLYRRSALEDEQGRPALGGKSIFKSKISTKTLLKMYERDDYTFWSQAMCCPKPGREQHFDLKWAKSCQVDPARPQIKIDLHDYNPEIGREEGDAPPPAAVNLSQCETALFMDPAPSEARDKRQDPHARNAVVAEAIDAWERRYLLESWAGRADYMDVIHKIFEMAERWSISTLYVEEVVFSNVYRHWINYLTEPGQVYADRHLQVCAVRPGKANKDTRITARIPSWRSGLYYINRSDSSSLGTHWNEEFVREMSEYPNGHTCDLLDALGYDTKLQPPESPYQHQMRMWRERSGDRFPHGTRDPITGY